MQEIIIVIILILVVGVVIWRTYKLFTRKKTDSNRCAGCDIDCALRDLKPKDCDKTKKD